MNGDVSLWSIDYNTELLVLRHILPERVHSCPITALRVSGERQDTLLIGDKSGKISACETVKLEQLNAISLSGFHSGVFQNGNRIDTFYNEKSVFLNKVSNNIFEGTIKSSYSLSTHKVRITFNPKEKSIECLEKLQNL